MNWFFTADEHYGHANIIRFCDRPFNNVDEMDEAIINKHNSVVGRKDTVVHVGDFTMHPNKWEVHERWLARLNGSHIFVRGNHDKWIPKGGNNRPFDSWEKKINDQWIIACHFPLRSWPRSFHGSWHVFGHVHGRLDKNRVPRAVDIGVDSWDFYPVLLEEIAEICIKDDLKGVENTP